MPARYRLRVITGIYLAAFAISTVAVRGNIDTHPEVRRAVIESYRFDPTSLATSPAKPLPELKQPMESDPEIVVLPIFETTSRRVPRGLDEAIAKSRSLGPTNESKFGTGVHEKDFGKVRAFAYTILYIPICFGLSW